MVVGDPLGVKITTDTRVLVPRHAGLGRFSIWTCGGNAGSTFTNEISRWSRVSMPSSSWISCSTIHCQIGGETAYDAFDGVLLVSS